MVTRTDERVSVAKVLVEFTFEEAALVKRLLLQESLDSEGSSDPTGIVITDLDSNRKINTIKAFRVIAGKGLRDAKDIVDDWHQNPRPVSLVEDPEPEQVQDAHRELALCGAQYYIELNGGVVDSALAALA